MNPDDYGECEGCGAQLYPGEDYDGFCVLCAMEDEE